MNKNTNTEFLCAVFCCCVQTFYSLLQSKNNFFFMVTVSHLPSFNLLFICRQQDKDSKDEAAKAEKELEEIRKVIDESGGKLSNRGLQCDVRKQGYTQDVK